MKLTIGDKILVVALVIFSIAFAIFMNKADSNINDKYVSIQVNGEEINAIEFSKDIIGEEFRIETEFGYNVIKFGDGELKIVDASCLDKLCIKMGTISKVGQVLVCLPNRLVIEIREKGGSETPGKEIDSFIF